MNKLRILYVCRLFNGFETSVKLKKWDPTGVPTIYRMINALNMSENHNVKLVITQKSHNKDLIIPYLSKINFKKFDSSVIALSAINLTYLPKLGRLFQEFFHICTVIVLLFKKKYSCMYADNANLYIAAIVSRLRIVPVVFRVMGVYPAMRDIVNKKGVKNAFLKWCYGSPFSLVVCTQDGSGVEPWIERAINPNTPVHILINGVENYNMQPSENYNVFEKFSIPRDKFIILFLGKLEKIKGIYDFIDGFKIANKILDNFLHAVVVGHGEEYYKIKNAIKDHNSVTLIPRVPHSEIFQFHNIADIYVSTNRLANLTNANLESMSSGSCMIIPSSQNDTYVDIETDKLLTNNAVYRIQYPPSKQHVSDAIVFLFNHPELREKLSSNAYNESRKFISSWDFRIKKELTIIEGVLI